jgi:hypothetical protein
MLLLMVCFARVKTLEGCFDVEGSQLDRSWQRVLPDASELETPCRAVDLQT